MTGGNFWGRVVGFARGLFSKAAPHLTNAITQAKPHVRTLATKAIESAIDSAVDHVSQKIRKVQEGKGIKGTTRKRGIKKTKKRRFIDRLPDRL